MKRTIEVEIDCEDDECGQCPLESFHAGYPGRGFWYTCEGFGNVEIEPSRTSHFRCEPCKAAEVKRHCGCPSTGPRCQCESD